MKCVSLIACLTLSSLLVGCQKQQPEITTQAEKQNAAVVLDRQDPAEPANATMAFDAGVRKPDGIIFPAIKNQDGSMSDQYKAGIVNYGNNVYYFPYVRSAYGNALSWFLSQKTNLEVTSQVPDSVVLKDTTAYGWEISHDHVVGHFVTFRKN